jgi:hypothetical protein
MIRQITATILGHPWDLWGLSQLFDGTDSFRTLVRSPKPEGRPTIDTTNPNAVTRFRIHGYDIAAPLTSDELVWDAAAGKVDLRDLRPIADQTIMRLNGLARTFDPTFIPVKLTHLSFEHENGAGSMTAGNWTPNKDMTYLGVQGQRGIASHILPLADSRPAINFVLDAMTLPVTWASLYLVLDAITTDVGDKHKLKKLGWLTDDELSDLTNSANNSRNIREGARHGNRVESTRPLIPLDVAQILTSKLVVCWLYWLAEQASP